jgi:cell wall-associated NlpC family hydrolase
MVLANDFVKTALSQEGDKYIFGIEVKPSDLNPQAFDCSEIVQWALARRGVTFTDGSWLQARACKTISVAQGIATRGALLFRFSSNPYVGGRPTFAHVAISQGNGLTIEARSTKYGVGVFPAAGRGWTHAGLIPGVDYTNVIASGVSDWAQSAWGWADAIDLIAPTNAPQGIVTDERLMVFLNRLAWWLRSQFQAKLP